MYMRYFATTKDAFLMQIQMPLAGQTEKVLNKQLEGNADTDLCLIIIYTILQHKLSSFHRYVTYAYTHTCPCKTETRLSRGVQSSVYIYLCMYINMSTYIFINKYNTISMY